MISVFSSLCTYAACHVLDRAGSVWEYMLIGIYIYLRIVNLSEPVPLNSLFLLEDGGCFKFTHQPSSVACWFLKSTVIWNIIFLNCNILRNKVRTTCLIGCESTIIFSYFLLKCCGAFANMSGLERTWDRSKAAAEFTLSKSNPGLRIG